MPHSADGEFFRHKREWSRRKDTVLASYLPEYLPKLIHGVKRPVCIVDGFAGPGGFGDGEPGSPQIICDIIQKARNNPASYGVPITPLFVERDPALFATLNERLGGFRGIELHNSDFRDVVPLIESRARVESLFLYLDPFTVEALEWASLDRLFSLVGSRSVEILLNFNVAVFVRAGLSALSQSVPVDAGDTEEAEQFVGTGAESLSRVAGDDWWIGVLRSSSSFEDQCRRITEGYMARLRKRFKEVCCHEVKEKASHSRVKYVLVFGSRSSEALALMNDAMAASREQFVAASRPSGGTLFEVLPENLVPDSSKLPSYILVELTQSMSRSNLVSAVVRRHFSLFKRTEILEAVRELVRQGRIVPQDGRQRTNDNSILERQRVPTQ